MYIYTLLSALEKVQNPSRDFAASRSDVVQILYAYNTYSPVRPGRNGADRLVRHLRLLGRLSWSFCHEQWSNQSIQNVLLMYFITNVLLTNILHYSVRQKKKGHHEMARHSQGCSFSFPRNVYIFSRFTFSIFGGLNSLLGAVKVRWAITHSWSEDAIPRLTFSKPLAATLFVSLPFYGPWKPSSACTHRGRWTTLLLSVRTVCPYLVQCLQAAVQAWHIFVS